MSWLTIPLGEVVTFLSGFAFKSELFNSDGRGLPIVRIRDVVRGRSETFYDGPFDSRYVVRDGDFLIGMDGEFNLARWQGGDALLNQRVCKIDHVENNVDRDFIAKFLPLALKKIEAATPFVTVKHLSTKTLNQIPIPIPPLDEQRRIAAILDQAEELRAKRRAAIALLDQLPQAIFLEMFGDPVTNPMGWSMEKLSTFGTLDRGVSKHRPRNAPELLGGAHPLIQTGDVANSDGYIRKYTTTYSDLGLKQSKMWPAGTLCITIAANIAKTGILSFNACFPDSVVGFTAQKAESTQYVRIWLSFLQKTLEDAAPESAQKNINLEILRNLQVPVPPAGLQSAFNDRVNSIYKAKVSQSSSLDELDDLVFALQFQLLGGER